MLCAHMSIEQPSHSKGFVPLNIYTLPCPVYSVAASSVFLCSVVHMSKYCTVKHNDVRCNILQLK